MGYKEDKERFVSGSTGGSVARINLVCLTALTTYALWSVVDARLARARPLAAWQLASIEFAILVAPLLCALTLAADYPMTLNAVIATLVIILSYWPLSEDVPPLSPMPDKTSRPASIARIQLEPFSRPFVTSYRAIMMVMTVICILAVDFPVFPREFAKAETWGTSLMDLGVGSFVFSLGVISSLPLLRHTDQRPYLASVLHSAKKALPIIALGCVRVVMVKGVEYPEHVTEYGVHWNFFFTMALIPVFGTALERLATSLDAHWIGLIVSTAHQGLLSSTQLQEWTLEAARTNLVSQNKEGIVSFPGYLAIHLLGLASGLYILPPDPYFFSIQRQLVAADAPNEVKRKLDEKRSKAWRDKPGKLANVLGSYAVVWWACYWLAIKLTGSQVSRRLANLPYVLWITAFNTSFLFLYLVVHLVATRRATLNGTRGIHDPPPPPVAAPTIFRAINQNGLVVFLVANLLTGFVNVSIESMYTSDLKAMLVLLTYCSVVVGVAWSLRRRRIKF
ncbi:hypothetical protein JCM3766R1_005927 [Sporobolomyces carnicolor]